MSSAEKPFLAKASSRNHAVWDVYDQMRTARLNVKCLTCEIRRIERQSKTIEIVLALSGASSIGALSFLQSGSGKTAWSVFGIVAMVLALLKPIFPLTDKRVKKERLLASYRILEHDLYCITVGIKERHAYDDQAKREFRSALARKEGLMVHSEGTCSKRILRRCQAAVNSELPLDSFYIPQ
ncbi:MAG TPA: hypothetical protein VGW57_11140 [Chthoniobacterales bacterium]|nr:hypothetical protein [Chthoniobacterales bacterium]